MLAVTEGRFALAVGTRGLGSMTVGLNSNVVATLSSVPRATNVSNDSVGRLLTSLRLRVHRVGVLCLSLRGLLRGNLGGGRCGI
jgi:hypothetical protein